MKCLALVPMLLGGCSSSGLIFNWKSEDPVVIIEKPPMRMSYSGKFDDRDRQMFNHAVHHLSTIPYQDHNYTIPMGSTVVVNTTDMDEQINTVTKNYD